ncbi:MAG: PQQ-dependent sugar dehydrogenase [Actinomycetota bacterium]
MTWDRVAVVTLAATLAFGVAVTAAGGATAKIRSTKVKDGLNQPTAFAFAPGNRLFYVEKNTGEIRIWNRNGGGDRRFFLVRGVNGNGERGMLGIAIHPDYPDPAFVYAYVTRRVDGSMKNQIVRLENVGGRGRNLTKIFSSPASASPYHNGGKIAFGPDGMLYAVVGDGHDARRAQQLGDDRGKILRMTPNGGVPNDNPLGNRRAYAYGIRNSFGFAFDPDGGNLWETENGPECNDELNRIVAGRNFGWGPNETCAGNAPRNTNQDGPDPVLPKRWYNPTIGPTGIAFCDGCGLGAASEGAAFFGAVNTGQVRRVVMSADRRDVRDQAIVYNHPSSVLSVEAAPSGVVYFSDFNAIYKLVRRG